MFNESDDTIRITLTKNATTAQEMQVNVVVPQGNFGVHTILLLFGTIIDGNTNSSVGISSLLL